MQGILEFGFTATKPEPNWPPLIGTRHASYSSEGFSAWFWRFGGVVTQGWGHPLHITSLTLKRARVSRAQSSSRTMVTLTPLGVPSE